MNNQSKNLKFEVLLFAGDINVYSVARAFHEEYGIKPYVYGKYPTGPCYNSEIMHYNSNPRADIQEVFSELVGNFAEEHKDVDILLIGCGDSYVQLISANKGVFPKNIVAPYISIEMMNELTNKERFYRFCDKTGIDYPETFIHRESVGMDFELSFPPPFIAKPANGVEYWRHPFPKQKKVYKADSMEELQSILKDVYDSGYNDSMIIQEFISGDDTYMRVLTCYSDKSAKVKMMCLGHVLLEEHTPYGIGNHAVIITEYDEELEKRFKKLLEDLEYVGFSNFDIKYDVKDGKYKVFEINTRQGRSNYYVTGSGANIAGLLVKDYIEKSDIKEHMVRNEHLWMVVPRGVAFKYIRQKSYREQMRRLIRARKWVNPLFYKEDHGILRKIKLLKSQLGHFIKYKKYMYK